MKYNKVMTDMLNAWYKDDRKFYATKPNYPVYIYESGQYCGLVLPIYHK